MPCSSYLDATQDQRRGLELGQAMLSRLASYPPDKLTGQVGVGFAGIIDDIAKRQLSLKQYKEAEKSYQKALNLVAHAQGIDEEFRGKLKAGVYHQLGRVTQEQRQWPQAEQYYQQALQIYDEYNDRHEQAGTYHQLGMVAQEQRQWQQAEQYYQQALQIYVEYNDRYCAGRHLPPVGYGGPGAAAVAAGRAVLPAGLADLRLSTTTATRRPGPTTSWA